MLWLPGGQPDTACPDRRGPACHHPLPAARTGTACGDRVSGDFRLLGTEISKVAPRPDNGSQRLQDSAFPKQRGEVGQDDTTLLMYWEGEQETEALNPYKRAL